MDSITLGRPRRCINKSEMYMPLRAFSGGGIYFPPSNEQEKIGSVLTHMCRNSNLRNRNNETVGDGPAECQSPIPIPMLNKMGKVTMNRDSDRRSKGLVP